VKIFSFSDLHAHNYPEFSCIDEDGLNSRFASQLEAMQLFRKDCRGGQAELITFSGDVFHLKNFVDSQVLRSVMKEFKALSEIAPVVVCPGNHDYRGWGSDPVLINALEDFLPNIIIPGEGGYKIKGWTVKAFPFVRNVGDLVKTLQDMPEQAQTIALLHQDVIGMAYGAFTVVKGITAQLVSRKFTYGLLGHFHGMTKLAGNVYIVGSLVQLNFSEAGQKKGWIIIDTESGKTWERENVLSPQFHDVKLLEGECLLDKNFNATQLDRDYFRIKVSGEKVPGDIVSARWRRVSIETRNTKPERGDLRLSDSHDALVRKYVKAKWGGGEGAVETLVELGKRYL
jgi:DNA repair exonuclease SbcCD nuclease subunit